MTKYHIKKDGTPGICRAKENCPLGGTNEHFESKESAQEYADNKNKSEHGILPGLDNSVSDEQKELIEKRDNLMKSIETLKGISLLKARKELKRVEYALDGKDYDNELEQKKKERERLLEEHEKKDLESKRNAEILANKETLELPKSIQQYVVTRGNWNKSNISAYRGEQALKERTNTGIAMYGQGRYTTTDKSYAKKYGTVRDVEIDELPDNPLRLKTTSSFELLEQEVAKENNVNYRDLYTKMDVSDLIKKMGYDGLTLGAGKDMIIVKY